MSIIEKAKNFLTGGEDQKVVIIGVDCLSRQIVFDRLKDEMPNTRKLMEDGTYGNIRSVTPPITSPAWYCMMSSKSPGTLGAYGFRHRKIGSYTDKYFATADKIDDDRAWNIIGDHGKEVGVIGVPTTFPPEEVNGFIVTSFLTPGIDSDFVRPKEMKQEILDRAKFDGEYSSKDNSYMLDVEDFRSDDNERILHDIFEMTEKRAKIMTDLMEKKDWDFFMTVFMGPDRLHHGFWKYWDENHKDYEEGNKFESSFKEYYSFFDDQVGRILDKTDENTTVIIVSDHGAKPMDGCICLNEFLREEGHLTLKEEPDEMQRLDESMIDWENTEAWGWGGYYARLFLNVEGREEDGQVSEEEYEDKREELIEKLENLKGPDGDDIGTKVMKPEEVYDNPKGDWPDLMVFFGDLAWRSSGSVGTDSIYLMENDTGPDHANHDWDGVFIANRPGSEGLGRISGMNIKDVAPTVLKEMEIPIPDDFEGEPIKISKED